MTGVLAAQPADWTREDWLSWRRERIGGSDLAALCGFSRFGTPTSVFYDKIGETVEQAPTKPMLWGQKHEPLLIDVFEEETGFHVLHPQTLAVDERCSWRGATLDGLVTHSADVALDDPAAFLGVCEIKCTSEFAWDDLPDEYAVQIQWQMGVTGFERCWVPVLHHGNNDRIYGPYDFDPRAYTALCSIADRFWLDHVMTRIPPPVDGNEATTAALKAAFPDGLGDPVELDAQVLDAARQLPAAKQRAKDAEVEVDRIENRLRSALGDSPAGGVRGDDGEVVPIVTWKPQKSERLDTKALKAAHASICEEFTVARTTRVLRTTKALTDLVSEGAQ